MPTIDQLPGANQAQDTDTIPISQGGITRHVTLLALRTFFGLAGAGGSAVASVAGKVGAVILGVADVSGAVAKASNLSDLTNPTAARGNLGLGAAAVLGVGSTGGVASFDDARFNAPRVVSGALNSANKLVLTLSDGSTLAPIDLSALTGSSGGGGTTATPSVLLPAVAAYTGISRNARDILNNTGACGSLSDATPAQYAAALEALNIGIVRGNYVTGAGSKLSTMQAIRSAQTSLGSVRLARFVCLVMAYINDTVPLSTQLPLMKAMLDADVLYAIEGPNELNNVYAGNGSRGPNDTTQKSSGTNYKANLIDWMQQLYAFKAANSDEFNAKKVLLIGGTIASGILTDYTAMNIEDYVDLFAVHFYAGQGRQPSFPYGPSDTTGYATNVYKAGAAGYSATGKRRGIFTEAGATTDGHNYAVSGNSQAKYIANQDMEAWFIGATGVINYQLFDGNTGDGNVESNFGLVQSDKVTLKPAGIMRGRIQNIIALKNNAKDPANTSDTAAFKPGVNPNQLVVVGVTNKANGVGPIGVMDKSDGTSVLWVWNEPTIDNGGAEVIPAADPITVYLPRSRRWRLHDPLASDSLTAGAWTTSDTVALSLLGYPMAIELDTPPGWTVSGGDPADVTPTGSTPFMLGQTNNNYARNYAGAQPDDLATTVGPAPGQLMHPGNMAIIIATNRNGFTMACAGAVATYGPWQEPTATYQMMQAWAVPILNAHQTFTVTGMDSAGSAQLFEVPPFISVDILHDVGTWTGPNYGGPNTVTVPLPAVPAGTIGIFAVGIRDPSGYEQYQQSADTSVVIRNFITNTNMAYASQAFSGTIAAGRAAGTVTWPTSNIRIESYTPPTVVGMVFHL